MSSMGHNSGLSVEAGHLKEHIAEWMRLTDCKSKPVQDEQVSKGGRGVEGGISAAARELGIQRTEAVRAKQVAALEPEAKQVARELRLDDNQSALLKAAREPTAEQQVARLRSLAEANEKAKQDRDVNKVIALTAAEEFAAWLARSIGEEEVTTLIDWLEGTKPKDVIAAIRRLTKETPPIMDEGYAF